MAESGENSPGTDRGIDEDSDVVELTDEIHMPAAEEDESEEGEPSEPDADGDDESTKPTDTSGEDDGDDVGDDPPTTDRLSQEALEEAMKNDAGIEESDDDGYDRQAVVKTAKMGAVTEEMAEMHHGGGATDAQQMVSGARFSPQIIPSPPEVLVKKWQEGIPGSVQRIVDPDESADEIAPATSIEEESDVEELQQDDVEEIEPGSSAPPQEPPPEKPKSQPSAPPPDDERVSAANKAAKDPEMTGLVQELLEEEEQKKKQEQLEPREIWFQNVFTEEYLRSVPSDITEITEKEVDFLEQSLRLKKDSRILDLACGFGRHSLEMANRGYEMVGLDLSKPLLERAVEAADKRSLDINFIRGDMRELSFSAVFDGCVCWNTSLGYFDDQTNLGVLHGINRALKSGGRLVVDVVNRDHVVGQTPTRLWWEGNGCIFLEETEFNHQTSILETHRSYIYEDGTPPLEHTTFIRLYNVHELRQMLHVAGFNVLEVSGARHHKGYFLGEASKRIIVLAEKRG